MQGRCVRIHTAWWRACLTTLLIVCGNVTQPSVASGAESQAAFKGPGSRIRVLLPHMSPSWFLNRSRRLLKDGRPAEAHQLAQSALALYPHSTELRLGAAFAAMQSGHCRLIASYLDPLRSKPLTPDLRHRADMLRGACQGPWRWVALIGMTAGYRPSLVDRQRDVTIPLQPGSQMYDACVRLAPLCDPGQPFVSRGQRESGVDLWSNLTVRALYRAGGNWNYDLDAILFRRRPSRTGFAGDGLIVRVAAISRQAARWQFRIGGETGISRFQQGRADLAVSQTHQRTDIGGSFRHSASLNSHLGLSHLRVRSQWLDLARIRYDYSLTGTVTRRLTVSLGGAHERTRQSGPGQMPRSRARETGVGLRWTGDWVAVHLRHRWRYETFRDRLSFFAAPHRARTRTTNLDLMPGDTLAWLNLKVVVSFEYRKISTPDPLRPPSSKTLFLRLSREIFSG